MPGGGGGQTVNTQQQSNTAVNMGPWKTQQPYLGQVFGEAQRLYNKGAPQYYPKSTVAPTNFGQAGGYQSLVDYSTGGKPDLLLNSGEEIGLKTIRGDFLNPNSNPWLRGTYSNAADSVSRAFSNTVAPTTDALFASAGRFGGGARFNAQRENALGLGETLNKLATDIYGGNYQIERDRQNNAATGGIQQMFANRMMLPSALMQAGNQKQGWDQAVLSDDVNRWNSNQMGDWQNLMRYKSLIDGSYGQQGTTNSQSWGTQMQQGGGGNPFAMGLGGILSLGSLAGNLGWQPFAAGGLFGSDRRLKTDVEKVGKDKDTGLDLYAYRYKGDPKTYPKVVGPMAQDIEKKFPDAVVEIGGRKVVSPLIMGRFLRTPFDLEAA